MDGLTYQTLIEEFKEELEEISNDCELEGLPARGSTFDLRVEALMKEERFAPLFEEA
jgi:hypothetical protein